MFSISVRMNAVLYNMMFCMVACGMINFLDGYFNTKHEVKDTHFEMTGLDVFIQDKYYSEQAASFQFDMKADISDLFNWNTNIIFLQIVCEYETEQDRRNAVVVWDQRIPREHLEFYKLNLKDEWVEYYLTDMTKNLKGKKINVVLQWEQMTGIGPYYRGKHAIGSFTMPEEFVAENKRRQPRPGPRKRVENY